MTYAEIVAAARGAPPRFLGERFDAAGRPVPASGNTIVGHLRPGPARDALTALRDRLAATPAGRAFAWLPPSSYHMTLFDGVLHARREAGFWPEGLDADVTDAEADAFMIARLRPMRLEDGPTLRMAPVAVEPAPGGGLWTRMATADAGEERRARAFRDRCAEAARLDARPGHEAYIFHITLAYAVDWPSAAEAEAFDTALDEADAAFRAAAPIIEIGPPELCRFADMTLFDPVAVLR